MATEKGKRNRKNEEDVRRKKKKKKKKVEWNSKGGGGWEQLRFLLEEFERAKGVQVSCLELESLRDRCCVVEVSDADDVKLLGKSIKGAFGASWRECLCEGQGKVPLPAGSPSLLMLSSSALRSIHLLRGFRSMTKECRAVKLFSKHMKPEEQISLLKNRVNIASGTPSRVKKLIEAEALGLSRLQVVVLDMHPDVKGYSLFTLPQVRDEFWELFHNYFYQPMVQGNLRICLYGPYHSAVPHTDVLSV